MKCTKFKEGDVVLVKSCAGTSIPAVKVKLMTKIIVPGAKGNKFDWPGYICWKAVLVCEKEVKMLRKQFQIPYTYPSDVETQVFDKDIIKRIKTENKTVTRRRQPKAYVQRGRARNHKS